MTIQEQNEIADALRELRGSMGGIKSEINDSLIETENVLEQRVRLPGVGGVELPCIPEMEALGSEIVIGGHAERVEAAVLIRVEHFVTTGEPILPTGTSLVLTGHDVVDPHSGRTMAFRGRSLRVLEMSLDSTRTYYRVRMGSAK